MARHKQWGSSRRQHSKGRKRPRSWHRGRNRDAHFLEAERLFRDAEKRAA